jgi:TPR repeat protein
VSAWPSGSRAEGGLCAGTDDALCAGASAAECTDRALFAWSETEDDRAVACVARTLSEACTLDDPRACGFAGRLWLDGRGVTRDVRRGLGMLVRACDAGVAVACAVVIRWLSDPHGGSDDLPEAQDLRARMDAEHDCAIGRPDACYQIGILFYTGRDSFPRDRTQSARAYGRGCDLGDSRACNNFADALAYGEGVGRDLERAAETFDKACRLGESLGCSNLGYCEEHGSGVRRDLGRARALYRDACATGDPYGCLHAAMLVAEDSGAPRDPPRALPYWVRRCAANEARACAFVGIIYEDGPDGLTRDEAKSQQAMSRACKLGEPHACDWAKGRAFE